MSAWTNDDLQAVKTAIIDLIQGKRRTTISVAGRSVSYTQVNLKELREMRDEIAASLVRASGKSRSIRIRGGKDL